LDASLTALYWSSRETVLLTLTLTIQLTLGIMMVLFPVVTSATTCNLRRNVKVSWYYLLDTEHSYYTVFIYENSQGNYEIRREVL